MEVALGRAGGLQHVARLADPVLQLGHLRPRPALGVVERLLEAVAVRVQAEALDQRLHPLGARPPRGELCAQVRLALARVPHPAGEVSEGGVVEPGGWDDHTLLLERARVRRHAARLGRTDVRVVRAARREPDEIGPVEERGDHRDVGQVGAAAVGVVEDPRRTRLVALVEDRRHGGRHRAEVHRDVLGLHHHPAALVEERGGGVAALLDVGRVGRTHQHGAHLVAGRPERAEHDLKGDGVETAHRSSTTASASARACQPGGTTRVAPAARRSRGRRARPLPGRARGPRAGRRRSERCGRRGPRPAPARPAAARRRAGRRPRARSPARGRPPDRRSRSAPRARGRRRPGARRERGRGSRRRRARRPGRRSEGRMWRVSRGPTPLSGGAQAV